jgi:hypothetical protein
VAADLRTQPWFIGVITIVTAVPLAHAFAWREVHRVLHDDPAQLVLLIVIGAALAFVGAYLPLRFRLKPITLSGRLAEWVGGLAAGLSIGLVGSAAGWLAGFHTIWALLIWFLFGSSTVAAYSILLGRLNKRDG